MSLQAAKDIAENIFNSKVDTYLATRNPSRKAYVLLTVDGVEVMKSTDTISDRYLVSRRWDMVGRIMMDLEKKYVSKHGPISTQKVDFKLEAVPFEYEHSITEEGVVMPTGEQLPVNDLTTKDVVDFGKEVGRDSAKQALVWTIASLAAKGMKAVIEAVVLGKTKVK